MRFSLPSAACLLLFGALASAADPATKYTDGATGIEFLGWTDPTGFRVGIAMPQSPEKDLIAQIVAPVASTTGWGSIDFGKTMTDHLLVVAWPNGKEVMLSPRIAEGYDVSDGAMIYQTNPVKLTQVPDGSFVNDTHVTSTFVCGGCINSDSFAAGDEVAVFSWAYSLTSVADAADVNTQLSDHTLEGEPYGSFGVTLAQARSDDYDTWAAMTSGGGGGGKEGEAGEEGDDGGASTPPATKPAPGGTTPPADVVVGAPVYGAGFYAGMSVVVLLYMAQPFL